MKLFSKNLLLINFLLIFMIREKLNSHVKLILDVGVACFRNNYMQTVMNRFEINV